MRIIELLVVIAIAAFAFAMLRQANPMAETLFVNFVYLFVCFAVAMAVGRQERQRTFWVGFLVTCVLYLGFALQPDPSGMYPRIDGEEITTKMSMFLFDEMHPGFELGPAPVVGSGGGIFCIQEALDSDPLGEDDAGQDEDDPLGVNDVVTSERWEETTASGGIKSYTFTISCPVAETSDVDLGHFMAISHSAWALLLGWVVGHLSQFVSTLSRKSSLV